MIDELKKEIEELKQKLHNVQRQAMSLSGEIQRAQYDLEMFHDHEYGSGDMPPYLVAMEGVPPTYTTCNSCGCVMNDNDLYCLECPEP